MPSLAAFHPQVVHFVVALIVVGVLFRVLSLLLPRQAWLSPAALALVGLGTLASIVAVRTGADAHGPVERVPGAGVAVADHETWGERARNVFLLLVALEAVAATLASRQISTARTAQTAAAIAGVLALGILYKAASNGGELVYGYAGGVGIRSGDPADVNRLLIAAGFHQAAVDRQSGRPHDAAAIMEVVADRFPDNLELQLSRVESLVRDRGDATAALMRLDAIRVPTEDTLLRVRAGLLRASALSARGDLTAARQVLETLKAEFPANAQVQERLTELTQPQ